MNFQQPTESVRPLYIFDLDDTLALTDHRRHFVDTPEKSKDRRNWRAHFEACEGDSPVAAVVETFKQLRASGADAWIWSGRMDYVRTQTECWLVKHTGLTIEEAGSNSILKMRPSDDWSADNFLKQRWLKEMSDEDRGRLVAAFDDRDRVVDMFRIQGVACFQVNYGKF